MLAPDSVTVVGGALTVAVDDAVFDPSLFDPALDGAVAEGGADTDGEMAFERVEDGADPAVVELVPPVGAAGAAATGAACIPMVASWRGASGG